MPGLTDKQIKQVREELDNCTNPLFFFHDDADGLASFLQLFHLKKEGKGVIVKRSNLQKGMMRKISEYGPDKVFVLDIAALDEDFVEECKVPIIWIDHHEPQHFDKVKIFNSRMNGVENNRPVAYLAYQIAQKDLWIAMVGCIGDWVLPEFAEEFSEKYPDLLPKDVKTPEDALFATKLGRLVKIMSFVLKGRQSDIMRAIEIMKKIDDPYDILEGKTEHGKKLHKFFNRINDQYESLRKMLKQSKQEGNFIVFNYPNSETSFTKDLSNEVLFENPDKIVVIGRDDREEVKMSIRASNYILPPLLEEALSGFQGLGGGHEHACGARVRSDQFDDFMEKFKACISKAEKITD